MRGNPLFGDWHGIPRAEGAQFVPTPIGELCLTCEEAVVAGDTGEMMPYVSDDGAVETKPMHRECLLLGVVGHRYGLCRCTSYEGLSKRQAALELDHRIGLLHGRN